MDKALRHQRKMLKYKKRLNQLQLKHGEGNFYAYRSSGKPCSCVFCSPDKAVSKKTERQAAKKEILQLVNE